MPGLRAYRDWRFFLNLAGAERAARKKRIAEVQEICCSWG